MASTSLGEVIYTRLTSQSGLNQAVKGNVFEEFRHDIVPSLAYTYTIEDVGNDPYAGKDLIAYELIISVIAETVKKADVIVPLVIAALDYATWTDGNYSVLGVFLIDRDTTEIQVDAPIKRLTVVDLRFEAQVRQS